MKRSRPSSSSAAEPAAKRAKSSKDKAKSKSKSKSKSKAKEEKKKKKKDVTEEEEEESAEPPKPTKKKSKATEAPNEEERLAAHVVATYETRLPEMRACLGDITPGIPYDETAHHGSLTDDERLFVANKQATFNSERTASTAKKIGLERAIAISNMVILHNCAQHNIPSHRTAWYLYNDEHTLRMIAVLH